MNNLLFNKHHRTTNNCFFVWTLIFAAFLGSTAMAQWRECATEMTPEDFAFLRELNTKATALLAPLTYPYHIPLKIHIVRKSDGTGGLRLGQLDTAMQDLNGLWEPMDMQFFQYGSIDYINSDFFYSIPDNQLIRDSLAQWNSVSYAINAYFTNTLAGICGQNRSGFKAVLVANSCAVTAHSLTHEVGHFFGLPHTFEKSNGLECPDGSNCATAGDLICDTPADPCTTGCTDNNCVYDNSYPVPLDSCGNNTPYAPPVNNVMAYQQPCRDTLTPGQRTVAIAKLVSARTYLFDKTIYVSASAGGIEDGTPSNPYNTLTEAVNAASAGDYIFITSGNYTSDILTITKRLNLEKWNIGGIPTVIGGSGAMILSTSEEMDYEEK